MPSDHAERCCLIWPGARQKNILIAPAEDSNIQPGLRSLLLPFLIYCFGTNYMPNFLQVLPFGISRYFSYVVQKLALENRKLWLLKLPFLMWTWRACFGSHKHNSGCFWSLACCYHNPNPEGGSFWLIRIWSYPMKGKKEKHKDESSKIWITPCSLPYLISFPLCTLPWREDSYIDIPPSNHYQVRRAPVVLS